MPEIIELKIKDTKNIYTELAEALVPYREKPVGFVEFIVEGTKKSPVIGIRYPGRKLRKRELKKPTAQSALWANLLDFVVIPYINGKAIDDAEFTYAKILKDFQENKKDNEKFWKILEDLYKSNKITEKPPKLPGIDPVIFLLVLKWIWIQEDRENVRVGTGHQRGHD